MSFLPLPIRRTWNENSFYSISLRSCLKILESLQILRKGPFIYYVITFLEFLDLPPSYVSMFLVLRISKNWHFLTPPTSADVIYEWSLVHGCCFRPIIDHFVLSGSWNFWQSGLASFKSETRFWKVFLKLFVKLKNSFSFKPFRLKCPVLVLQQQKQF